MYHVLRINSYSDTSSIYDDLGKLELLTTTELNDANTFASDNVLNGVNLANHDDITTKFNGDPEIIGLSSVNTIEVLEDVSALSISSQTNSEGNLVITVNGECGCPKHRKASIKFNFAALVATSSMVIDSL